MAGSDGSIASAIRLDQPAERANARAVLFGLEPVDLHLRGPGTLCRRWRRACRLRAGITDRPALDHPAEGEGEIVGVGGIGQRPRRR